MHRRRFISMGLSAIAGLIIPRFILARPLASVHLVYKIGVRKGLLGRGNIVGHLQINIETSRYSITIWAEQITKKILFIPIGRDTEDAAMDLVLDADHINPLRIRLTAFGRIVGGRLVSEGVIVSDKKDGRVTSRLKIKEKFDGSAVASYSFMGSTPVAREFGKRPSDPVTTLVSIAHGETAVLTTSLFSVDGRFELGSRTLRARTAADGSTVLATGPDSGQKFWDFKSNTFVQIADERISRLRIAGYNVFKSIDVRCKHTAPLENVGHERIFPEIMGE